jgi:hypothetical protein
MELTRCDQNGLFTGCMNARVVRGTVREVYCYILDIVDFREDE